MKLARLICWIMAFLMFFSVLPIPGGDTYVWNKGCYIFISIGLMFVGLAIFKFTWIRALLFILLYWIALELFIRALF